MDYNQNQGGYPQQQYPQGGRAAKAPKKEKVNVWEGIGIVRPRSANENDPITFYPFDNDGKTGSININVKITEDTGLVDENGNPRQQHVTVPVSVRTNKNITAAQLKGVVSGMKVRVVGRLKLESYKSKKSGQDVTAMVVSAYVFEILEMPMQSASAYGQVPQQPAYAQGGYPAQAPAPQGYAPQQPFPPQYGQGYMPQQPVYAQPAYPQQTPPQQMPPLQGYAPQPPMPQNGQVPPQAPPAYYQQQPGTGNPVIEDLPVGI